MEWDWDGYKDEEKYMDFTQNPIKTSFSHFYIYIYIFFFIFFLGKIYFSHLILF